MKKIVLLTLAMLTLIACKEEKKHPEARNDSVS